MVITEITEKISRMGNNSSFILINLQMLLFVLHCHIPLGRRSLQGFLEPTSKDKFAITTQTNIMQSDLQTKNGKS